MKSKKAINKLLSLAKLKGFSIVIGNYLYNRFNRHLKTIRNATGQNKTRQKWIQEAFIEKLQKQDCLEDSIDEKLLHFKIDQKIYEEINKRVEVVKKFRNFSKKQWFLEAIQEKLEREENNMKEMLKEKIDSFENSISE